MSEKSCKNCKFGQKGKRCMVNQTCHAFDLHFFTEIEDKTSNHNDNKPKEEE